MKTEYGHLTYCTNIHSGENWADHFHEIKTHFPKVKSELAAETMMGLGLRISRQMQIDLGDLHRLEEFKQWLNDNQAYVFTVNGFPYGNFHSDVIKDKVHHPDWTSPERLEYTLRLFDILNNLLPESVESGGVSTSPLSYRPWFASPDSLTEATEAATLQIVQVAEHLDKIKKESGKILHLDIEPEPDGILGNGTEFLSWYEGSLLPMAEKYFSDKGYTKQIAGDLVREHLRICYDVCHMAVEFEDQPDLISQLKSKEVKIGKIQLSSALKLPPQSSPDVLKDFIEDQYLHQVVIQSSDNNQLRYKDLHEAINNTHSRDAEWRIHFHVPVFTANYQQLQSTQDYITEILELHREELLTDHMEIETYTWEVLPPEWQLPLSRSIIREFEFILDQIQ